ncbi:MAG: hypothetical protein VCA55_02025 [Verrucomicrobiales bacterium]|jgi:hypothetical protein
MNNKHMACVTLGMAIVGMAYATMSFYNKLKLAQDEEQAANAAYDSAVFGCSAQQRSFIILRDKTKAVREYLAQWEPHFRQTRNPQFGEALVNLRIKQDDIITLSQGFETVNMDKGGTIPRTLQARLVFEDDYIKTLNWLARLESSMPATRVSSCRLSKGQSGNDIKMELTIDVPILEEDEEEKSKT